MDCVWFVCFEIWVFFFIFFFRYLYLIKGFFYLIIELIGICDDVNVLIMFLGFMGFK